MEEAVEEVEEEEGHGEARSDQDHPTEQIIRRRRIKANEFFTVDELLNRNDLFYTFRL